jgi:hypothetical protein
MKWLRVLQIPLTSCRIWRNLILQYAAISFRCGPCVRSITAAQPTTTPIPVQLSEPEFTAFIFPHLSMPKRGPKCKLGSYRVFNLILWVLYMGMQWKGLPVPKDPNGTLAIHDTTIYKVFATWADDGPVTLTV